MNFETKKDKFRSAFNASWSKDTCLPSMKDQWNETSKEIGQCAVTALILQEYFGGQILYCSDLDHYWNILPDNNELDMTFSQFTNNENKSVTDIISREKILSSENEITYQTRKRYYLLKSNVTKNLRENGYKAKELKGNNNRLIFISSNAEGEYISDVIEIISSPNKFCQHFRYQLKWLPSNVKDKLTYERNNLNATLKKQKIGICYLFQIKVADGKWKWEKLYSIRAGVLIDAYKTGDNENDIAHFYFKLTDYLFYDEADLTEKLIKKSNEKFYAFFDSTFKDQHILNPSKASKFKIYNKFDMTHFKVISDNNTYYPPFVYFTGIKKNNTKEIKVKFNKLTCQSYYTLIEGKSYSFEFGTYCKTFPTTFNLKLECDKNIFSSPDEYIYKINSGYNEESWLLMTKILEKSVWSIIKFKSEFPENIQTKPLDIIINLPIHVNRKIIFRIIEVFSDIAFGVGTGSIAISKVLTDWDWWYIPTIIGYFVWVITKIITKLWRG